MLGVEFGDLLFVVCDVTCEHGDLLGEAEDFAPGAGEQTFIVSDGNGGFDQIDALGDEIGAVAAVGVVELAYIR